MLRANGNLLRVLVCDAPICLVYYHCYQRPDGVCSTGNCDMPSPTKPTNYTDPTNPTNPTNPNHRTHFPIIVVDGQTVCLLHAV